MSEERELTDAEHKECLAHFLNHVVCICVTYHEKDGNGKAIGEEIFRGYTGFVISAKGEWFIVTAGHVLRRLEEISEHGIVVSRGLADYFGSDATSEIPVPFEILDQPYAFIDDETGLDVGVIYLRQMYRELIEKNVTPVPFRRRAIIDFSEFYGFSIIGFPAEESRILAGSETQAGGEVMPVLVPINVNQEKPLDNSAYPRIVGKVIAMGELSSIEGISGGPMLGYRREGNERVYELIGLQSSWLKSERKTYGCPVVPFLERLAIKRDKMKID